MSEKVAVVTGSSRGIGRAVAIQLGQDGYNVVVNYHNNPALAEEVLADIKNAGGNGICVGADVSVPASAQELIDKTVHSFGRLDVLVNNAGISHDQLLMRLSDEDWNRMIATNLGAAFYCCRAAIKPMIKNRFGRIINIGSVVGLSGNPGQVHYAAAKAGIIGMTGSIAREYGMRGITANVVAPGYIETDMTANINPDQNKKIAEGIALRRLGKPEDVAGLVSFLASGQASYITGQTLRVDGGMSI